MSKLPDLMVTFLVLTSASLTKSWGSEVSQEPLCVGMGTEKTIRNGSETVTESPGYMRWDLVFYPSLQISNSVPLPAARLTYFIPYHPHFWLPNLLLLCPTHFTRLDGNSLVIFLRVAEQESQGRRSVRKKGSVSHRKTGQEISC